MFIKTHHEEK